MDTPKKPTSSLSSTPIKRMPPVRSLDLDTPKKPTSSLSSTPIKRTPPVRSLDLVTPVKRETRRNVAMSLKEVRQAALGLRKRKERSDLDDLAILEKQLKADSPKKRGSGSRSQVELPPVYKTLHEMFNGLVSSIRLLGLKKHMPTFQNIYKSMQNLDNKNLTYKHLAQMKYLLPEVIMLKKILKKDEITCCMSPELQITLVEGSVINTKEKDQSAYLQLKEVFKQRLLDFIKDHSEEDEIPEFELPHPFNTNKKLNTPKIVPNNSSQELKPQSVTLSHMSPSFQRRFSKKAPINITNSTQTPEKKSPLSSYSSSPKDCFANTDLEKGTPAKSVISTPMRLMTQTPELKTPQNKTGKSIPDFVSKKSARTKLFMSPNKIIKENNETKNKEIIVECDDDDDELGLPKSIWESIKEKEKRVKEEKLEGLDEKIQRQKMIKLLPSTYNMISSILLSQNKSVITKQELIHKLIANNLKINDQGEVEEQLKLLQEIVPNWISEEPTLCGGILYRVDRKCNSQEIHQRLASAN